MKQIVTELINDGNSIAEKVIQAQTGLPPGVTDPVLKEVESLIGRAIEKLNGHPAVQPAQEPAGVSAAKAASIVALLLVSGLLFTACASSPSKAHIIRVEAVGTKVGIGQNPATGVYELGIMRVQTELTSIPVLFTNDEFKVPAAVMSYEANAHSAVFGNAAVSSTIATGSNAVNTTLGGNHLPINSGTGTSNNLTPVSH